jgi:hypothetical protein
MCFYIFAPNAPIIVTYALETITLSFFTRTENFVDIHITNDSNNNVNVLRIIYPNVFQAINPHWRYWITGRKYLHQTGAFKNHTATMSDNDDPTNITYSLADIKITPYKEDGITIKFPHNKSFSGKKILADINICQDIPSQSNIILSRLGFQLFELDMDSDNIGPHESIMMRLKFCPLNNTINRQGRIHGFFNWLIDKQYLHYCILGPTNILELFNERLNLYSKNMAKHSQFVKAIKDKTISQMGKVTYKEWFIHVFPRRLKMILNPFTEGHVDVRLGMPSYLQSDAIDKLPPIPTWKKRLYDWYIPSSGEKFSIYFSARAHNIWLNLFVLFFSIVLILRFVSDTLEKIGYKNQIIDLLQEMSHADFWSSWAAANPIKLFIFGLSIPVLLKIFTFLSDCLRERKSNKRLKV